MLKVVAYTTQQDELARAVCCRAGFSGVCRTVTQLLADLEGRAEQVAKVAVLELRAPDGKIAEQTSLKAFEMVNLGGKITHYVQAEVHAPGVRPAVQRQVNAFGVFLNVFTSAANFHTATTRTATLFRGGTSRAAVQEAIEHVFIADSVAEVLVNNVVFTGRLGCPVSRNNRGILRSLLSCGLAKSVEPCESIDDTFTHSLVLKGVAVELADGADSTTTCEANARMNIGRTGVVNLFFGVTGGVPLASGLEERLQGVSARLMAALLQAV
jgi:hypothetical protein